MLPTYVTILAVCYPLMLHVTVLLVCYQFMLRHCQYATHLCYDTVSMLSTYFTCYNTVSMLSIYVTILSVCYPLMLHVTILLVCYPFMLRHCQYAIHVRRFDESETIWTEIIMTKSGGVLIFPGRVWVKQRRTVRLAQLYKPLHFRCTERVVYPAFIKQSTAIFAFNLT